LFASFPPSSTGGQCVQSMWAVRFDVGAWYAERGVESFWPSVEVQFVVRGREGEDEWRHYHVPVLLGPWSYSTYRGS
jgi:5-hydroxyisourate hydrolase